MRLDFDSDVIKENGKSMLDHHSCSKGYHERPNNERNAAAIPGMNEYLQNTRMPIMKQAMIMMCQPYTYREMVFTQ